MNNPIYPDSSNLTYTPEEIEMIEKATCKCDTCPNWGTAISGNGCKTIYDIAPCMLKSHEDVIACMLTRPLRNNEQANQMREKREKLVQGLDELLKQLQLEGIHITFDFSNARTINKHYNSVEFIGID